MDKQNIATCTKQYYGCNSTYIQENLPALRKRIHRLLSAHRILFHTLRQTCGQTTQEKRKTERNTIGSQGTRTARLDKNWLTISDAARLMQMSRTTLYKVIADHGIELKRFSARTVRIARADLEKVTYNRETQLYKTAKEQSDDLGRWMTREQVMEKYDVTYSWFYSVLKKRGIKSRIIGSLGFYDKEEMHRVFSNIELESITEWYTFEELRQTTGMRTESISDFCLTHKVPRMKKNGITYVSKKDWDNARGNNIDRSMYYTVAEITEKYQMSSNHLFHLLKEHKVPRIRKGMFSYFPKEDVDKLLEYRLSKLNRR